MKVPFGEMILFHPHKDRIDYEVKEIITCDECKYYEKDTCVCERWGIHREKNGFCDQAEQRLNMENNEIICDVSVIENELIDYLYEINCKADISVEDIAHSITMMIQNKIMTCL